MVFAYAPDGDGAGLAEAGGTVFGTMAELPRLLALGARGGPDEGVR
jgi:hypothetical protein